MFFISNVLYKWKVTSGIFMIIGGCFVAMGIGVTLNIQAVVWANYYGRAHVGAISGVADALVVLGSAFGPLPFGFIRDTTGSWELIFIVCILLP
eukprot:UN01321